MTIQPNPCLDPCHFYYDTADGKSHLKLKTDGGIICGPDGLEVVFPAGFVPTFSQHSDDFEGTVALPAPIGTTGLLAPGSGPLTGPLSMAGLPDMTVTHSSQVRIDASVFEEMWGSSPGVSEMSLAASIDGGVNWVKIHSTILNVNGAGTMTTAPGWLPAIWHVPDGYLLQPRFFMAYLALSGTTAAEIAAVGPISARMSIHRLFSGALP